jgi:hypothetical protein
MGATGLMGATGRPQRRGLGVATKPTRLANLRTTVIRVDKSLAPMARAREKRNRVPGWGSGDTGRRWAERSELFARLRACQFLSYP